MKVIDPGHVYLLDQLDVFDPFDKGVLKFVKREGEGYPGNVGHHPGTNLQEVLRALIDRIKYFDGQIPDVRNLSALNHLRSTILMLELRAAERHGRTLGLTRQEFLKIELLDVCNKCGHIGCKGECH